MTFQTSGDDVVRVQGQAGTASDDGSSQSQQLCSVLNVVIDHSMEEPTIFEMEERKQMLEIQEASLPIKVPVVRVFGPIHRGTNTHLPPQQSACLYIHGAFPYLLARPRAAGPDGSFLGRSCSGSVDWDSVQSVDKIADKLCHILESSLQSLDFEGNKSVVDGVPTKFPKKTSTKILRRISVVCGRGFYTFCPGPPAPFLRVEYYDPKLRWKVKWMLEKGIDVPLAYHPDSHQYSQADGDQPLQFHCYEAHIPYTMQFFKDCNLAGMSYIHLKAAVFRGTLPNGKKHRGLALPDITDTGTEHLFLKSNTSSTIMWDGQAIHTSSNPMKTSMQPPPIRKTSCDVELDCSVRDITNVAEVMTSMPNEQEAREDIQWRAVPSLQEIWRQERQRMAKLLPPQHDFLSKSSQNSLSTRAETDNGPAFTLNVKKNSPSRSGSVLASKGMWKLVGVTSGLKEEFLRALSDIIKRHERDIQNADTAVMKEKAIDNFPLKSSSTVNKPPAATPTMNETMDTLNSLGAQFGEFGGNDFRQDDVILSPSRTPLSISQTQSTNGIAIEPCNSVNSVRTPTQHSNGSLALSTTQTRSVLHYSCSQEIQEQSSQNLDPLLYSQLIDRGDTVVAEPYQGIEDVIDAETLLPFENLFFGDEHCRVIFSVETDLTTRQRICGGPALTCRRYGHSDAFDRAKPGIYETMISGTYVDGILGTEDQDFEEEEMDGSKFEKTLSTLATQLPNQASRDSETKERDSESLQFSQITNRFTNMRSARLVPAFEPTIDDSDSNEESSDDLNIESNSKIGLTTSEQVDRNLPVKLRLPWNENGCFVALSSPPVRGEIRSSSVALHKIETGSDVPSWLDHVTNYNASVPNTDANQSARCPRLPNAGAYVGTTKLPPTRGSVEHWLQRSKRKQSESSCANPMNKKSNALLPEHPESKIRPQNSTNKAHANNPELVSNIQNTPKLHGIEEVVWDQTQPQLTPSQLTPVDTGGRRHLSNRDGLYSADICSPVSKASGTSTAQRQAPQTKPKPAVQDFHRHALEGIGNQGGRIHVQGGGELKAQTKHSQNSTASVGSSLPTPVTFMSIEVHVQCRSGDSRLDARKIAMVPNPGKDRVVAIIFVFGTDPGGGESLKVAERGILFVPLEAEKSSKQHQVAKIKMSMPKASLSIVSPLSVECVADEKALLLRLASIVRMRDPDMLLSWDTQAAGLGYLIERGVCLGKGVNGNDQEKQSTGVDLARLLGRTPHDNDKKSFGVSSGPMEVNRASEEGAKPGLEGVASGLTAKNWKGSGLGSDWDERVGAGAAAASIVGRLVFAAWKIVSEEVKHANASYLPAVVAAVLGKRIPYHNDLTLTKWYAQSQGRERWRALNYRLLQATASLLLFDALDIIGRAGEAARLSCVEFSQSFPGIRGSQYKVEGVLLRALQSLRSDERGSKRGVANVPQSNNSMVESSTPMDSEGSGSHTQSPWKLRRGFGGHAPICVSSTQDRDRQYYFFSPSMHDTNKQEALEVQPLTLEPQSGHYTDPVVVCDFTALYPSLIIAYNLCYSTCAGKLEYHSTRQEMRVHGKTTGHVGPFQYSEQKTATVLSHHTKHVPQSMNAETTPMYKDRCYVAPTGTIYVSESVLKGVLPQVLDELLTTRAMLKRAAKEYKNRVPGLSPAVLRQLEARQLALKYVANVTYGYTSATFSGRCAMPLLADTIVECGRKTLRRAIDLTNRLGREGTKWAGCTVIYGDTDSLFIKLPGRTLKEAFEFGEEICRRVTADNPPPVQLKFEKVYMGSIMQTMKRYCGMKYESKDQRKAVFEAKGLETVRRDQCALTQKVLRNALIMLFKNGVEAVKSYLYRQWALIFGGHLPVSDFILTGRVRSKYRGGREGPVQAVLARRMGEADPGRVIRHKERLPYVIVATPGVTFRLKDCVLAPLELLERWDAYTIHSTYYITKHVNASLQRCLGLHPHYINVNAWYEACPKPRRRIQFWPVSSRNRKMITSYFGSDSCSICNAKCEARGRCRAVICAKCRDARTETAFIANRKLSAIQKAAHDLAKTCSTCNHCFEDGNTFAAVTLRESPSPSSMFAAASGPEQCLAIPMANCLCIDCPTLFERHQMRDNEIEAIGVYEALEM